jgi:crossover junction endodeoxyribonuclease RusA
VTNINDSTVIYVLGDPAAQGSKRLVRTKGGRTLMIENSRKVKPWRQAVGEAAMTCGCKIREGDVAMRAIVRFARPVSHFKKDGTVRPSSSARPGKADCDKLLRSICDALTGIAYHDDRQVACVAIDRVWCKDGEAPGAIIKINACPESGRWVYEVEDYT